MKSISLENKKILIVDDETDILDSLEELLDMCALVRAETFEQASRYLKTTEFDIVILDIMGVDGFELLKKAHKKDLVTVMLTANDLNPDSIKKSYKRGASSYIPKEEMVNIETHLIDVLKAKKEGKNPWVRWYERFADFCEARFGPDWKKDDEKFWEKMIYY